MPLVRPPANRPIRVKPVGVSGIQTDRNPNGGGLTTVVFDSFDRADGAIGTADTGQVWEQMIGTWVVASNVANLTVDGLNNENIAVLESGVANCTVSCAFIAPETGWRLCWRAADKDHHFMILRVGGDFNMYRKTSAGNFTQIGTGTVAVNSGDIVSAVLDGDNHTIQVNGVTCIGPIVDANLNTATKHGIGVTGAGGNARWNNFRVERP